MFEKIKLHLSEWWYIYFFSGLSIVAYIVFYLMIYYGIKQAAIEVKKVGLKNIVHDIWEGENNGK